MARTYKQRPDGTYQTTVKARKPDGSIYRRNVSSKSEKILKRIVAKACEDFEKGKIDIHHNITFAKLADVFFDVYKKGSKQEYSYRKTYEKHLLDPLGKMRITAIQPMHAKQVLNILMEKEKPQLGKRTIEEIILIARQILDVAIEHDVIGKNVFSKLKLPKGLPEKERVPIAPHQQELIEKSWHTHKMGVPAMIMLYLGLRRGEILALEWNDIDFERKQLSVTKQIVFDKAGKPHVDKPKSEKSYRTISIPDHIMNVLESVPAEKREKEKLICFAVRSGSYMSQSSYDSAWRSFMNHLNLFAGGKPASRSRPRIQMMDEFTAHQLRHTCATMLFESGVDTKTAQKMLGHANIEITLKIYTHLREEKEKASTDAYNQMLMEKYHNADDKTKSDALSVDLSEVDSVPAPPTIDNVVYFPFGQKVG